MSIIMYECIAITKDLGTRRDFWKARNEEVLDKMVREWSNLKYCHLSRLFVIPLKKAQAENIFWTFLYFLTYNMSIRLLYITLIITTMLKVTFNIIQSYDG